MHRFTVIKLAACGLLAACGCAQSGPVMRAQSPAALQQASHGYHGTVHDAAASHLHGSQVTHYNLGPDGQPYQAGGHLGHGGHFAQGQCPPEGCPQGQCRTGRCGNGQPACQPNHGYTYSYKVPNDLRYPAPNVPGGAVMYPYYTHKGPSDFFRK